jgi:hypothetical protein
VRTKKLGGIFLKLDFEKAYDKVNWEFLRTVLSCNGYEPGVVHRLMLLVSGGKTDININGEIGPYFRMQGVSGGEI